MTDMNELKNMIEEMGAGAQSFMARYDKKFNDLERAIALKDAPGGGLGGSYQGRNSLQEFIGKIGAKRSKKYQDLFGAVNSDGWQNSKDFFDAVLSGRHHPNLKVNASMNEGSGSDGAFLVPTEYASEIHNVAVESEIVLPRCLVEPMTSNTKKVPATEIGDHNANLFGGIVGYWTAEEGSLTEANPKFRDMELKAKKLTCLFKFSNEWAEDVPNSESKLSLLAAQGLGWFRDRALLKGSGAGMPLGILNADCTIEVGKESGQGSDTIIYKNLAKMVGSIHPACFQNSVWVIHVSAIPELLELSIPVGTGGSAYPVLSESNGVFKVLTRPVIFTEKTEPLGDRGDVMLCDFSQYIAGVRKEFRFEKSIHVGFTEDTSYGRLITRMDGQPLWDEPLTLDGGTQVSPFVVLGAR